MILADCHIKGRVVEIELDLHASIEGTNTAGKPALLRLRSLFWGLKPSEAQEAAGAGRHEKCLRPGVVSLKSSCFLAISRSRSFLAGTFVTTTLERTP